MFLLVLMSILDLRTSGSLNFSVSMISRVKSRVLGPPLGALTAAVLAVYPVLAALRVKLPLWDTLKLYFPWASVEAV